MAVGCHLMDILANINIENGEKMENFTNNFVLFFKFFVFSL